MPTVVMATSGLPFSCATSTSAMPQAAPAALARMRRMNGFSPMMSVTEYIIVMSLVPTQGATFPEAIAETMILGNPFAHDAGRQRRALGAAERDHRVDLAACDEV